MGLRRIYRRWKRQRAHEAYKSQQAQFSNLLTTSPKNSGPSPDDGPDQPEKSETAKDVLDTDRDMGARSSQVEAKQGDPRSLASAQAETRLKSSVARPHARLLRALAEMEEAKKGADLADKTE